MFINKLRDNSMKKNNYSICNYCGAKHPLNRCGNCGKESLECPCYDCLWHYWENKEPIEFNKYNKQEG